MSYSSNEIAALAKRAARGAGLPWGLAEEAAMAAQWLAAFNLPGPAMLADVLARHEGVELAQGSPKIEGAQWRGDAWLSPLICGPALSDRASRLVQGGSVEIKGVTHPLLMLPFMAATARQIKAPVSLIWDDVYAASDGVNLSLRAERSELDDFGSVDMTCTANADMANPVTPRLRGQLSDDCLKRLTALAEKSFAPATKESRTLGAGADKSDND